MGGHQKDMQAQSANIDLQLDLLGWTITCRLLSSLGFAFGLACAQTHNHI